MGDPPVAPAEALSARLLRASCVVAGLLLVYFALVGALQLPDTPLSQVVLAWGMPALLVFWARSEQRRVGRSIAGLNGGIWFLVFGLLLVPYYLIRTRAHRSGKAAAVVLAALLAPPLGYVAGAGVTLAALVPPRYLPATAGQAGLRITPDVGRGIAERDFQVLAAFLSEERRRHGSFPYDGDTLGTWWAASRRGQPMPADPFTGLGYYYARQDSGYGLRSAGPDHHIETSDDVQFEWPPRRTDPPSRRGAALPPD